MTNNIPIIMAEIDKLKSISKSLGIDIDVTHDYRANELKIVVEDSFRKNTITMTYILNACYTDTDILNGVDLSIIGLLDSQSSEVYQMRKNDLVKYNFYLEKESTIPAEALVIPYKFIPKKVIYNDPATIVFWMDGTKTVVKICESDKKRGKFDTWSGFALCLAKKVYGDRFHQVFNKHCSEPDDELFDKNKLVFDDIEYLSLRDDINDLFEGVFYNAKKNN